MASKSHWVLVAAAVLGLASGCGGGEDSTTGASAGGSTGGTVGVLTVSAATNAARNGSYTPTGARFTSGSNFGFNGQTKDGKFETEVVMSAAGVVLRAHVWFFDAGGAIRFFGCDGGKAVACTGITYSASANQVVFSAARMAQVNPSLDGSGSDAVISGGEGLTVDGALEVK